MLLMLMELLLAQPLEKIHQDCNIKLPLSPQRADSEGGDNAQAVAAAWNP